MRGKMIEICLIVFMTQRPMRQTIWIAVNRWTRLSGTWRKYM